MTALAEMMTIFGTDRIMEVAASYKKKLVTSENCPGIPLKILCSRLVARSCAEPDVSSLVSKDTIDLLEKLLHLNAHERISAKEALEHPIFQNVK